MKKISTSTQSPAVKSKPAARVRKPAASASLATAKSGRQRAAAPDALPVEPVDTSYLRTLVGYNARRASLAIIETFMVRMAPYDLKVVDFSVLSLVAHNPGITSRQLCAALNVLPPNLVGLIATLERRGLIERLPHPSDGRAMGVHLTLQGVELMAQAEQTAFDLEMDATSRLTDAERKTLIRLLQKVYTPAD